VPLRHASLVLAAVLCGSAMTACGGGGGSTHLADAVPAAAAKGGGGPAATVSRRSPKYVSNPCTGTGSGAFVGGGEGLVAGGAATAAVGGYYNYVCSDGGGILGGNNDEIVGATAYNAAIAAGESNFVSSAYGFIGGGEYNSVSSGSSAIVGGSYNSVTGNQSVASGGASNTVSGGNSVVGGGDNNTVTADSSVVVGGTHNTASGHGSYVGSGGYNTASGQGAVVGGGYQNTASGTWAVIPGGYVTTASGTYSFAAGVRAQAQQTGTFVWSDGSNGDTPLSSSRAYQFLARASGGVTFYTNAAATVGATLAPGAGAWASLSDRNAKTDIVPLDDAAVLEKVTQLPISRWSYRSERGVRHVGPMAQDFYAAFNVGEDERHIASIDEDGVALAAIKALHRENAALHADDARVTARVAAQARQIDQMREQIRTLTAAVAAMRGR